MAANDEFPRGISQGVVLQASAPTVTFAPAIPGVSHVVTDIIAATTASSAISSPPPAVEVTDGSSTLVLLPVSLNIAANTTEAGFTWSGKWTGAQGAALTLEASSAIPSFGFIITTVNWYDI